jgi:hypothetical protein
MGDERQLVAVRHLDHTSKKTVIPERVWSQWLEALDRIGFWRSSLMPDERMVFLDCSVHIALESCRRGVYLVRQIESYNEPAALRGSLDTLCHLVGW